MIPNLILKGRQFRDKQSVIHPKIATFLFFSNVYCLFSLVAGALRNIRLIEPNIPLHLSRYEPQIP
jgi:hypothetical protein